MVRLYDNTLLCIDDDREMLDLLQHIFQKRDYKILTAADAEQALSLLALQEVGVILCDYNMPGMDGIQLLSIIRERYPDSMRLLLTGATDSELAVEAINKGSIFKFLRKPFVKSELLQTVNEAFALFNMGRENKSLTLQLSEANEKLNIINARLEEQVEEKSKEVIKLTFYDSVTDLPNKVFVTEWLEYAIKHFDKERGAISVLMLGIDRFKQIRESFGDSNSARIIRWIADETSRFIQRMDAVCGISGDIFYIVLHCPETLDIAEVAEDLLSRIQEPVNIEGKNVYLTAAIGISCYPDDGGEAGSIISNAESALYHARDKGGNNFQYYTQELNIRARHRMSMESALHKAIDNQEFLLYYQPRVSSETLRMAGAEALIRWNHPVRGLIMPAEFTHLLEETGLIKEVGEWVIKETCAMIRRCHAISPAKIKFSANLSPLQFKQDDLIARIRDIVMDQENASIIHFLELEITEGFLIEDFDRAKRLLDLLHDDGITLAIDDFGTGYSSLGYLTKLPIDNLKIDISFVRQIGVNSEADAVIRAIMLLAQSLNFKTTAEGIETEAQAQALRILGCNEFQGFLYGEPCPEQEFIGLLEEDGAKISAGDDEQRQDNRGSGRVINQS